MSVFTITVVMTIVFTISVLTDKTINASQGPKWVSSGFNRVSSGFKGGFSGFKGISRGRGMWGVLWA